MTDGATNRRAVLARSGYQRVRNESLANHSTPQQLILLVYEALLDRLAKLEHALEVRQERDFAEGLLKSMQLIQYGLRDAISFDLGGDVAVNLDRTYAAWMLTLEFLDTNRRPERLQSLIVQVREMRDTWRMAFQTAAGEGAR